MKILVAVDDSTCSAFAVDSVAERSWPKDSEVRVITVMEPLLAQYSFAGAYVIDSIMEAEKQVTEHCKQFVHEYRARLIPRFGESKVSGDVIQGFIADSIIEEAQRWEADLIVVGSHGRKGIQKFLLGSVAEKVASHAPCSIEIMKHKVESHEKKSGDISKSNLETIRFG